MKKVRIIYNAKSGQNKFKPYLEDVIAVFCEADYETTVFRISKSRDADAFVKNTPADTDLIVIAAGDGTINRIVNVMLKENIDVPIAIIPAGTSNDFATHIKMPTNFVESAKKIVKGTPQYIDIGRANDTYFINVLSAGMFASSSYKTPANLKKTFGQLSYFMTAAAQGLTFKPFEVDIKTNDGVLHERLDVFVVFNGSSVGRINKFSDNSSIQDGKLDMVMLRDCSIQEAIQLIGDIEDRTYLDNEHIVYIKESSIEIHITKGKCDRPDVDGDEGPDFPLKIKCISNRIRLVV